MINSSSVRVLGIDPGLNRTGWAIVEAKGNSYFHIASGVIKTSASNDLALRLNKIFVELGGNIDEHKPSAAAIENTYVNQNFASSLQLAHARAACMLSCANAQVGVREYQAKSVKKLLTGSGNADKEQMLKMLSLMLPSLTNIGADEADAIAIALTHLISCPAH